MKSFPGERVVNTSTEQRIYGKDGQLRSLTQGGMLLQHGPNGARVVSADRPDGSHITVLPGGGGWVQHPFFYRGAEYGRRTYVLHGVTYDRFYRVYPFHGLSLSVYAPVRYYPPAFYWWTVRTWPRSIAFNWGWQSTAWYGSYGSAFVPYAFYGEPSMWLTDYTLANSMDAAYQQELSDGGASSAPSSLEPLPPDVKDAVNVEIKRDLTVLQTEDQQQTYGQVLLNTPTGSIVEVLGDNQVHTFVAGSKLAVVDGNGTECMLTPGDAVKYTPPPPPSNAVVVDVKVAWAKDRQDCQTGSTVTLAIQDVQEMHNYMLANIDQGTIQMHAEQANGRFPQAPLGAGGPASTPLGFTAAAPPSDSNAQVELNAQSLEADRAEQNTSAH